MLSLNQFQHWEGQVIKITGGGLLKDIIIGIFTDFQEILVKIINSF